MHHEHPLRIIRYSIRNIWLLVFPIARNLFRLRPSPEAALRWMQGAWFDLLILLCILGFGWMHWYFRRFSAEHGRICVHEGVLFRHTRIFPAEHLSALTLEYPFWLRPFGAVYLCADTDAGMRRKNDLRLLIRRQDADAFRRLLPHFAQHGRDVRRFTVHFWRILVFSVLFSSSLSGALYVGTFWFQGGRISRDLLEELALLEHFSELSEEAARHLSGIPPAAAAIGIAAAAMRVLSLVNNLLRYSGFFLTADQKQLFLQSGLLTKRSVRMRRDMVNFLDLRQNLAARLCNIFSITVSCSGYSGQRGSVPVCLPILKKQETAAILPVLFPEARLMENRLKPPLSSWWGYVWQPVLWIVSLLPSAYLLRRLFPAAGGIIGFLRIMLLLPALWKLLVQITALLTSGISITDSQVCLRYCKGFVFHTIIAETDRIVKVRITQFPWQRWFGKCNALITFRAEYGRKCLLKNLERENLETLLHRRNAA